MDDVGDGERKESMRSIVAASIKEGVEDEKCVVAQYRTSKDQKKNFVQLMATVEKKNYVPIEWVIDIADESNGWFYGTGNELNE